MNDNITKIRPAVRGDLPAINDIYNHYVANCTCTWRVDPVTQQQRERWFGEHNDAHPAIVAELDGRVAGWACLSEFRGHCGYRHTVEDSLYLAPEFRGRGLGAVMLAELIRLAGRIGHHGIVAVISAEQESSIALHRKFGFVEAGRLREAGFKFDAWRDAVFMQLLLEPQA